MSGRRGFSFVHAADREAVISWLWDQAAGRELSARSYARVWGRSRDWTARRLAAGQDLLDRLRERLEAELLEAGWTPPNGVSSSTSCPLQNQGVRSVSPATTSNYRNIPSPVALATSPEAAADGELEDPELERARGAAGRYARRVREVSPYAQVDVDAWAGELLELRRSLGCSWRYLGQVFEHGIRSAFWRSVILEPAGLAKHFGRIDCERLAPKRAPQDRPRATNRRRRGRSIVGSSELPQEARGRLEGGLAGLGEVAKQVVEGPRAEAQGGGSAGSPRRGDRGEVGRSRRGSGPGVQGGA